MTKARDIASATTPNANAALLATFPHRNLIINGAMQVAQRSTSETGVTTTGVFVLDRFKLSVADTAEYTISQSTTAPSGFANSTKWENTTANASPSSAQYSTMTQYIEAQNLQHLKYGTSSAQSLTLSFWVRSNKTGTYIAELVQPDASFRHIGKAYTINSADTWEYKTITFAGDVSGVINNDNGHGMIVTWWLGAGSNFTSGTLQTSWGALDNTARAVGNVNLSDTIGNDWYITGVQLEVGNTETPFEHRSYGDELARCQRYYTSSFSGETTVGGSHPANYAGKAFAWCDHYGSSANRHAFNWNWPVPMRATPTITMYGNQWTSARVSKYNGGSSEYTISYSSGASRNGLAGYYEAGVSGDFVVAYVEAESEL